MNKDFKKLAEEFESRLGEQSEAVRVSVKLTKKHIVEDGEIKDSDEYDGFDIRPCNGDTIHCMEEVVDFCRYHGLNEFVTMTSEWNSENCHYASYIYCHVF